MKHALIALTAITMLTACAEGFHGRASGNNYESRATADVFRVPFPANN